MREYYPANTSRITFPGKYGIISGVLWFTLFTGKESNKMYDTALCEDNPSYMAAIQNLHEEYAHEDLRVKCFPGFDILCVRTRRKSHAIITCSDHLVLVYCINLVDVNTLCEGRIMFDSRKSLPP